MKSKPLILGVLAVLATLPTFADTENILVKNHHRPPDVKFANEPKLDKPQSFSFILLGEPQSYIKFDFNQPLFAFSQKT